MATQSSIPFAWRIPGTEESGKESNKPVQLTLHFRLHPWLEMLNNLGGGVINPLVLRLLIGG